MLKKLVGTVKSKVFSAEEDQSGDTKPHVMVKNKHDEEDDATDLQKKFEKSRKEKEAKERAEMKEAQEFFRKKHDVSALVADEIRESLRAKRVKLLFQPIFDLKTEKPIFHEVFTHLLDKAGHTTEPVKYIPIANRYGLSSWLDEVVVSKLLNSNSSPGTAFGINLAGETLRKSMEFFEELMNSVMETGFPPNNIFFEIKFHEIDKNGHTLTFIREAKSMQFNFILDYVGGGAKVIQMIQKLGFSHIKVDALQFAGFDTNKKLEQDLREIVKTAKESNIALIMERVETQKMYDFCKEIGFDCAQGYYLSKPNPEMINEMKREN